MNSYFVTVNGKEMEVKLNEFGEALIGRKRFSFELLKINTYHCLLKVNNKVIPLTRTVAGENEHLLAIHGEYYATDAQTRLEKKAAEIVSKQPGGEGAVVVKSPMPGMVLKLIHQPGQQVEAGDTIVILEAMKMENDITSPFSGVVSKVFVKEGSPVEKGGRLFLIDK